MKYTMYTCPCCGYKTLEEKPPGTYEICELCGWEDDAVQFGDPDIENIYNLYLAMCDSNIVADLKKHSKMVK